MVTKETMNCEIMSSMTKRKSPPSYTGQVENYSSGLKLNQDSLDIATAGTSKNGLHKENNPSHKTSFTT